MKTKILFCEYCGTEFEAWHRQKWHNCPKALEAKKEYLLQYQRDYYCRPNEFKRHHNLRHHHKGGRDHICRSCGKKTFNYFNCPNCLGKMERGDFEVPVTDCLGYELEMAI